MSLPNTKARLARAMDEASRKAGFNLATRAYKQGFDVSMMHASHGLDFNNFLFSEKNVI
ncbi:hypothetical protein [Bartonella heixiaziensis]|uniref:hypothetical protein n=1 Tax=Bartonella heixiaziensis TaxID=1461000 RepID=UPI003D2077A0